MTPPPASEADPRAPGAEAASPLVLQTLVLPDPSICGEVDLYVHRDPRVTLDLEDPEAGAAEAERGGTLAFLTGGTAWFDTYMNLFNLGVWSRACRLGGLALRLEGEGRVAIQIWRERTMHEADVLVERIVDLGGAPEIDLTAALSAPRGGGIAGSGGGAGEGSDDGTLPAQSGLIKLRLVAQGAARLTRGAWIAPPPADGPGRPPLPREISLAVAITTFRREAQLARSVARIAAFLDAEGADLGARVHVFVIDNGGTADPAAHPAVTRIENPNLGGAGGFARGLACARDGGYSHCLFMDDDAAFQMENLRRTIALLRLARSEAAAVAGAMISEARKWVMWENGSVFNRSCRPQFVGTDLRNAHAVAEMEFAAARPKPEGFYAGWWFFAFPVAEARRFPFPFFVRGDDISFSLAHDFDTVTLNGVVSFQEDFSAKESPLTLYLDLRNHLHQHLVHEGLDIGPWGTTRIALHFLLRSIVRMHYDSAEAQLAAWEDVMKGPDFFAENADMGRRRPEIAALARTEAWREVPPMGGHDVEEPSKAFSLAMKWALNGHLIPFFGRLGGRAHIPAAQRGLIWPIWGKRAARFYDVAGTRGYDVAHDKARFARIMARAARLALAWRRAYPALRAAHRRGYEEMTARPFWDDRFAGHQTAPASRQAAE